MYARGMSKREITGYFQELYGIDVSPDLISTVTCAVLDEIVAAAAGLGLSACLLRRDPGEDPQRRHGSQQGDPHPAGCARRRSQGCARPIAGAERGSQILAAGND